MKKSIKIGLFLLMGILIIVFSSLMISKNLKGTFSASASPCYDKNDYCPLTTEITATSANTYDVTSASFGADGTDTNSDTTAIQAALDKALSSSSVIKVVIPAGSNGAKRTYYIGGALKIHSNTILYVESNVTIIRQNGRSGYILKSDSDDTTSGYGQWHDIIIDGGIWNLNNISAGFHLGHGQNLIIRNTTVMNGAPGGHCINLSATKNIIVSKNTFKNHQNDDESARAPAINEFLHLDSALENEKNLLKPVDGTPVQNFVIEHNTFEDLLTAIGSHDHDLPYDADGNSNYDDEKDRYYCTEMGTNIKIRNNSFVDIHYDAINILYHKNVEIYGNTASAASDNVHRTFVYTLNTGANIHNNTVSGFANKVVLIADHNYVKSAYDVILDDNLIYKHDDGNIANVCLPDQDFPLAGNDDNEVSEEIKSGLGATTRYFIVRYEANGGTGSMADSMIHRGDVTAPVSFKKNGYHFVGWKLQKDRSKSYLVTYTSSSGKSVIDYVAETEMDSLGAKYLLYNSGVTVSKSYNIVHQGEILHFIAQWKKVDGISMKTQPTKTVYTTHDTAIDPAGGKLIVALSSDNTTDNNTNKDDVTSASINLSQATLSGFSQGVAGTQTITANYSGKTTTFTVTVNEPAVSKIQVTTMPSKVLYYPSDNNVNPAGGKLKVTYTDNYTEEINLSNATLSGFKKGVLGEQTITVTYEGKTTTFKVTVSLPAVSTIELTTMPYKLTYIPSDTNTTIDPTGGIMLVTFVDNTTEEKALDSATFTGYQKNVAGIQTITVTYEGKTTTFDINNITNDSKYVLIKYHINDGGLATEHSASIGLKNGYVTYNNDYLMTKIHYGESLSNNGLVNTLNASYLNVLKNGYVPKSGFQWNTKTDGTGTSYSQAKVYTSDDFCDASVKTCEITLYVNWVPDNIEAVLDIDSNSIAERITAGTKFSSLISQVQTTQTIVLYDNAGNVKSNSQVLKTGDYITVTQNETTASYYISVLGDVNGDGNVNEIDVAKLFQHYRGTTPIPANQQYYILAGDVVSDNMIKLTDVAKLFQYHKKIVENLN